MTGILKFFLVGSIATVLALFGFDQQQASAFEPTDEELQVIKQVYDLRQQVENIDVEDPDFWKVLDKYDRAVDYLNYMGIYAEGQEPDLDHLTDEYTSTRQFAQAVRDGEVQAPAPRKYTAPCDCPEDPEKSIYVRSGYKDPYKFLGVFTLYDHFAGDKSNPVTTGATGSSIFTPNWNTGLKNGVIPVCQVSTDTRPTDSSYRATIFMQAYDGVVLIPHDSEQKRTNFDMFHMKDNVEFDKQNNLASGPTITCTLTKVTAR